jgi:hypothetical protein
MRQAGLLDVVGGAVLALDQVEGDHLDVVDPLLGHEPAHPARVRRERRVVELHGEVLPESKRARPVT